MRPYQFSSRKRIRRCHYHNTGHCFPCFHPQQIFFSHYSDVTYVLGFLESPTTRMFIVNSKESSIGAPCYLPLWGESYYRSSPKMSKQNHCVSFTWPLNMPLEQFIIEMVFLVWFIIYIYIHNFYYGNYYRIQWIIFMLTAEFQNSK